MFRNAKLISSIFCVLLLFPTNNASAQYSNLSLNITGGPLLTVSGDPTTDVYPNGWSIGVDMIYKIHPNVGIMPFAFSYLRLSTDEDEMSDLIYHNSSASGIDEVTESSAWGILFVPGVQFNTSLEKKFVGFGQIGFGVTHSKLSFEAEGYEYDYGNRYSYTYSGEDSSNDLTMLIGGGVETKISTNLSFVGKTRYILFFDEEEKEGNTSFIEFTAGLKIHF